jgi:phosphate starvation-inducible protein PhoH and related proteins
MTETSQTVQLPTNESAMALAGLGDENLKFLSRHTGANLVLRGQELQIYGKEKSIGRKQRQFLILT